MSEGYFPRLEGPIGRIVKGILLIALAPVVAVLLNGFTPNLVVTLGNSTVDLSVVWALVKVFGPFMMVVAGLRELGVRL